MRFSVREGLMGTHRTAYIDPSPGLGFGLPAVSIPGSANESYEIHRAELSAPWLLNLLLTCLPLDASDVSTSAPC